MRQRKKRSPAGAAFVRSTPGSGHQIHLALRERIGHGLVARQIGLDPLGRPIGRLQEAHFPAGRFAPAAGLAVAVPRADLPMADLREASGLPA